jgi:hypothetical protein
MKALFLAVSVLIATVSFAQQYLRPNEELIYRFATTTGKQAWLVKDKKDGYIVYRYGTPKKMELEFPARNKESWKKFTYSFYFRGGGIQNEGMELNYISFHNNGVQYILYDTYYAAKGKSFTGIKVIDPKTKKEVVIEGLPASRKGTLVGFRDNGLVAIGEELYD